MSKPSAVRDLATLIAAWRRKFPLRPLPRELQLAAWRMCTSARPLGSALAGTAFEHDTKDGQNA